MCTHPCHQPSYTKQRQVLAEEEHARMGFWAWRKGPADEKTTQDETLLTLSECVCFFCLVFFVFFSSSSSASKLGGSPGDLNPNANTSTAQRTTPTTGKAKWALTTSDNSMTIVALAVSCCKTSAGYDPIVVFRSHTLVTVPNIFDGHFANWKLAAVNIRHFIYSILS